MIDKDGLIQPPSSEGSHAVPRTKNKLVTPKKIYKMPSRPHNWKRLVYKMKTFGKLELEDFDTLTDMTAFLDWYNGNLRNMNAKKAEEEIHEISKFLANSGKKYIFMNDNL